MCRLVLDDNKYNNSKNYWKALIINTENGFTIDELLEHKTDYTTNDLKDIYEIIEELGDLCLIKRIGKKFYILKPSILNV